MTMVPPTGPLLGTTPGGKALLLLLMCGAITTILNALVLSHHPSSWTMPSDPVDPQPQLLETTHPPPPPPSSGSSSVGGGGSSSSVGANVGGGKSALRSPTPPTDVESEQAKIRDRLKDPSHTPRLTKFKGRMEDFPAPAFHGCTEGGNAGLCKFSNVCYSRRDHMLVLAADGLDDPSRSFEANWYQPTSAFAETIVPLRQPKLVPREIYTNLTNVWWADSMLVMNCWQQHPDDKNPAHFIMGMGKLFVHASKYWDSPIPPTNNNITTPHETLDLLLYHQCAPIEGWDWAEYVRNIIWKKAQDEASIQGSLEDASMYLTFVDDGPELLPDDVVVCGKTVYQEPFTSGIYFSNNKRPVIDQWQAAMEKVVQNDPEVPKNLPPTTPETKDPRSVPRSKAYDQRYCINHLKIGALQRTEGTSLRHFKNLDEVALIAEQYTKEDFFVIRPNSSMSPSEQVGLFRSFDILLTPHGSHNVNMIFSGGHACFVEISAVYYDPGPRANGFAFATWWYNSYGHEPYNNSALAAQLPACLATGDFESPQDLDDPACPLFPTRLEFIHSDLVLNTTTIRYHLEKAIYTLCPGPTQLEED